MRKNLLVILTVLVGLGALVVPLHAQTAPKPDLGASKTTVDVDQVDARTVIRTLLKGVKAAFTIEPDVQGKVTLYMQNVTVERALMEVLRQVGAGYRYEAGLYRIVKLKSDPKIMSGAFTFDFNGADVREALRALFKRAGIAYTIAPDVQGKVTSSAQNMSFEGTLQMVLKQVGATYRVEGGVYQIVKRQVLPEPDPISENTIDLDLQEADIREALRALFKRMNVSYSIAPEVQGTVTATLRGVTFETALTNILKQVDATYRVEGGVYQIVKR